MDMDSNHSHITKTIYPTLENLGPKDQTLEDPSRKNSLTMKKRIFYYTLKIIKWMVRTERVYFYLLDQIIKYSNRTKNIK